MFSRLLNGAVCLVVLSPVAGVAQIQSGLEYDVYFLAGQSNAAGRGDAAELPSISGGAYVNPQTDVAFYYRSTLTNGSGQINTALTQDQFVALEAGSGHGFNNPSSAPVEFGPELSMGRSLADAYPTKNIAIIKYAHGGSNLASAWSASGSRYSTFLDVASDALDDITNAGATYNLQGLAWVQGESDTSTTRSNAYEANLTDMISRVRTDVFGGQAAPFVISRLSDNQYNSLSTGVLTVRAAQVAVADADPMAAWTNTDGAEFSTYNISTPIHFDAGGNIAQGQALANAFVSLTDPPDPPDPPVPGASEVIYQINAGTGFGDNGANPGSGATFADNLDGTFTLATATDSGVNNAAFVDSGPSDINTLAAASALGRSLLDTDTVTVRGTIDSSDADFRANGIELGVASAAGFRADPNMLLQIDDNGDRGGEAPWFGFDGPNAVNPNASATPGMTEASLQDGFSFEAVYTATGVTYTVTDIITTNEQGGEQIGATSMTYMLDFSGDPAYDLVADVGGGFGYFSFQKNGTGAQNAILSAFEIEVTTASTADPADLDGDGDVDDADFGIAFAAFTGPNNGPSSNPEADLDGDGDVDDADFGIAFAAFTGPGGPATVPEPGALALFSLGGVLLARRRRAS